jgi:hypothetical protein
MELLFHIHKFVQAWTIRGKGKHFWKMHFEQINSIQDEYDYQIVVFNLFSPSLSLFSLYYFSYKFQTQTTFFQLICICKRWCCLYLFEKGSERETDGKFTAFWINFMHVFLTFSYVCTLLNSQLTQKKNNKYFLTRTNETADYCSFTWGFISKQ